jgi:pyruvate, orthophosphate dikinase
LGVNERIFKKIKDQLKIHQHNLFNDKQDQYLILTKRLKSLIKKQYIIDFPDDPYKQLEFAISAIFKS